MKVTTSATVFVVVVLGLIVSPFLLNRQAPADASSSVTPFATKHDVDWVNLQRDHKALNQSFDSVKEAEDVCYAYARLVSYSDLKEKYDRGKFNDSYMSASLEFHIAAAGRQTARLGYAKMRTGQPLGCKYQDLTETFVIGQVGGLIMKYGLGMLKPDPSVLNAAELRAKNIDDKNKK